MKKILIFGLVLIFAGSLLAVPTEITVSDKKFPVTVNNAAAKITQQRTWTAIATVASAGQEPNDLGVAERTYLTVKAIAEGGDDKITIVRLSPAWNNVRFRCIGITDNQDVNFIVWSGTLANNSDCELVKTGKLAFVIGTQVSTTSTYEMADTVVVTAYCKLKSLLSNSPANELVAEAGWDLIGDDILVIVPEVVGCDAKLLAKGS